ncbi:MAG: hypothetical protein AABZ60_17465 [Planctomycetota bacterium]|mgnify:CR=1 FL=1
MTNNKKAVPSREVPVDSHLELKKQSLLPTEQLQRNEPKFMNKIQSLSTNYSPRTPLASEGVVPNLAGSSPLQPPYLNKGLSPAVNSNTNVLLPNPPEVLATNGTVAINQPNSSVRHYTSRTPLPLLQPAPMHQSSPGQTVPSSPSIPNGSSSLINTPRPLRDTSSINVGFRPNEPAPSALNMNIFQLFLIALMLIVSILLSFFLGRWTFSSSPTILSSGNDLLKKNQLGLDEKDKSYTIRVSSMPRVPYEVGRLNLKRAIQIKQKMIEAGYKEVEINRNGKDLVIDVGRFTDPHEEVLLLTLKKLKDFKMWDRKAFTNVYATKIDS